MAKNFKKGLSAFLAALMCTSTMSMAVNAAETVWQGDDAKLNIAAGENPYVYAIAQDPANNRWYYETSNHTVKKEATGGGAVHIFPIVDTTKVTGDWTPDGIYESGVSNYDVMYCCDAVTGTDGDFYYKRVNLEDGEYVSDTDAKRLRAIVENAYPYVSVEDAKAALKEAGFAQADELDRSELIAATQAAIWTIANPDSGDSYRYNKTATTAQKLTWGGYMHEFASEITNFTDSTTSRKYHSNPNGVGDRVNALIDFYLNKMEGVGAEAGQIVITNLDVSKTKIDKSDDTYAVELKVNLNHGTDENDNVVLNVYVNGEKVDDKTTEVTEATEYTVNVNAEINDVVKVVVSGTQNLERGVYFYIPEPHDIDGDGVATSREVSQNLIGVAAGETPVLAEKVYTVDVVDVNLEINKVDTNGNALKGAKFALFNADGDLVDTNTVDENGKLVFTNLIPGTYALKETVAPDGFVLPEETIEVVVYEDGSIKLNGNVSEVEKDSTEYVEYENFEVNGPQTTVVAEPGKETSTTEKIEVIANAAKTIVAVRTVTVNMSEVDVSVVSVVDDKNYSMESIQPALKFDRNSTADQKAQKVARELYTDNGHFHDPSTFTVTDAPEGYPFKYVGHGDYSGHYVSHVKVVYEKDDAGNAVKDAEGNYVIDHLEHASSGTPLHYAGELVKNIDGPYHYVTGTRSQQFLLMDKEGKTYYGYCIDLATGAESSTWYALANLEDNDYYATQEAEDHVRGIVFNGYWGTESGTGSLASLKEALKAAVASGDVKDNYNIKLVNRKKFTTDYELQEGEYHYGSYVYWDIPAVDVKLTDEVIDAMTEGEALDAMQAAIWSYANGSQATLNGIDGVVVGDMSVASSAMSDSLNGKNDPEGAARTRALYSWLMNQKADADDEKTVIINDKTFAKDMSLTVRDEISEGIYAAALSFSLDAELTEADELNVVLTYVDANGETQTIEAALTGSGALAAVDGIYTIDGLKLKEGEAFDFSLNIAGQQYLTKNAYIFTSEKGTKGSQTFVTLADGMINVNVTKSAEITFTVEDHAEVSFNRYQHSVEVVNTPAPPTKITFKSGEVSNISFMLIDKDGNIEFLRKIDVDGETSFEIPAEEGKISAVFVKQGNAQGMFWFSEEVDEEIVDATIKCVDDNNPSYKGYSTVAFGAGDHSYKFKNGKMITYTFTGSTAVLDNENSEGSDNLGTPETGNTGESEEEPGEIVDNKPTVEEEETDNNKNNGDNKVEEPVVEEPTLNYTVKGAEVAAWAVNDDDVTAIYIAANGKVPAVIWTSAAVDKETLTAFAEEFGADDYVAVSKEGKCSIKYQHNKNKTKTVTYTFTAINK